MVRDLLRQHGQDAIRESRRTFRGCRASLIHRGIRLNKMRDVGDVDAELKAAVRQDFDIDGIIEVARGRGIDRDGVAFSEIVAAGKIALAESHREAWPLLPRLPSETLSAGRIS